jgi:hypothetical protein
LGGQVLAHPFGKLGRHCAAQDRRWLEFHLARIVQHHRIEAQRVLGAAAAPRLEWWQRFGTGYPGRGEIDKALGRADRFRRLTWLRLFGFRRPRSR